MNSLGLCCVVCKQRANGQHFDVVSCRACAAFFRRWLVDKRQYNCINGGDNCNMEKIGRITCKACRLRLCQIAGLQEKKETGNGCNILGEEVKLVLSSESATPNLSKLVSAYRRSRQNITDQGQPFKSKQVLIDFFDAAIAPFAAMRPTELKIALLESCERQLEILNYCCVTLEHSTETIRRSVRCDRTKYRNKMQAFIGKLAMFPHDIGPHDLCAMMALVLCSKVNQMDTIMMMMENSMDCWNRYRENLLREWYYHMNGALGFKVAASMQMARLIAMLPQLEHLARCSTESQQQGQQDTFAIDDDNEVNSVLHAIVPVQQPSATAISSSQDPLELHQLCQLLAAHHRIWGASYELDHTHRQTFEDMLESPHNILAKAGSFTAHPPVMNTVERSVYFAELNALVTIEKHPRIDKGITAYRLLTVGILKAMPTYRRLTIGERAAVAYHQNMSMNHFLASFYSASMGRQTECFSDGLNTRDIFCAVKLFSADPYYVKLVDTFTSTTVMNFLRMVELPTPEEMAILLAIQCSDPAIPDLSKKSIEMLHDQQVHFCQLLWRHLQRQLGPTGGAKRYADLLILLGAVSSGTKRHRKLIEYFENFYLQQKHNIDLPKNTKIVF